MAAMQTKKNEIIQLVMGGQSCLPYVKGYHLQSHHQGEAALI